MDNETRSQAPHSESLDQLEDAPMLACKCGNKTWFLRADKVAECPFCENLVSVESLFTPEKLAS